MKVFNFNPAENFYEAFTPIYYVLKLFGLFPFSFNGKIKRDNLQFKFVDIIWSIIIMAVHFCLLAYNINLNSSSYYWVNSLILQNGYKVISIVGLVGGILTCFDHLINRKKIKEFLNIIEKFDEHVKKFAYFIFIIV